MNSRERVIGTIRNEPTDRVPFDFWAEPAAEKRLASYTGINDAELILRDYEVDIFHVPEQPPQEKKIGSFFQNLWGERYIYKPTEWGPVREDVAGALSNVTRFEEIKKFDWPSPKQFGYDGIKETCLRHRDKAIMYGMADIWERPALVRGLENALMDLYIHPDWTHFLSRKFTDFYKEEYTAAYEMSGKQIDIFLVMSDLGGQQGPLISRSMFDEFVAPYLKELIDRVHDLGAYVMFHSCGMVYPFIRRLIELGVDILDPIQPVTAEMQPERLSKDFAGEICFHGGIDLQNVLISDEREVIEEEIMRYQKCFWGNAGYICSPAHLFQPDIPPENIECFYSVKRSPSG